MLYQKMLQIKQLLCVDSYKGSKFWICTTKSDFGIFWQFILSNSKAIYIVEVKNHDLAYDLVDVASTISLLEIYCWSS